MLSSKTGKLLNDTDPSLTEFMSNRPETVTMETEAPASHKPMPEISNKSGSNAFQNMDDLANFIGKSNGDKEIRSVSDFES